MVRQTDAEVHQKAYLHILFRRLKDRVSYPLVDIAVNHGKCPLYKSVSAKPSLAGEEDILRR